MGKDHGGALPLPSWREGLHVRRPQQQSSLKHYMAYTSRESKPFLHYFAQTENPKTNFPQPSFRLFKNAQSKIENSWLEQSGNFIMQSYANSNFNQYSTCSNLYTNNWSNHYERVMVNNKQALEIRVIAISTNYLHNLQKVQGAMGKQPKSWVRCKVSATYCPFWSLGTSKAFPQLTGIGLFLLLPWHPMILSVNCPSPAVSTSVVRFLLILVVLARFVGWWLPVDLHLVFQGP